MAGIKQPIQDILARLASISVQNQDLETVPLYTRVFNNQIKRLRDGKIQAFPLPAAFVEVLAPENYNRLLNGFSEADLAFRIHLCHWFTDAQDGTYDQDLLIFDLRDQVIACLSNYRPTACGNLVLLAEMQHDDHDDIYVMLIDFKTNFIDSKGSPYDDCRTEYFFHEPPTTITLNAQAATKP